MLPHFSLSIHCHSVWPSVTWLINHQLHQCSGSAFKYSYHGKLIPIASCLMYVLKKIKQLKHARWLDVTQKSFIHCSHVFYSFKKKYCQKNLCHVIIYNLRYWVGATAWTSAAWISTALTSWHFDGQHECHRDETTFQLRTENWQKWRSDSRGIHSTESAR